MSAPCKCKKTECEECPEWIFTFADLVMLMMGFFVILWVLKPNPGKKGSSESADDYLVKVEASIRAGFGYTPDPQSKNPVDMQMIINGMSKVKLDGPGNGGRSPRDPKGPQGSDPDVTNIRPSHQATEGGKMLFERGSDVLTDEIKRELDEVANVVRGHRNIVMVKGHTSLDDMPENTPAEQLMDLSLRRAKAAADYLTTHGVEPQILRVQGCSTFEPLVHGEYNADSQRLNGRIEVEATATLLDDLAPQTPSRKTAPSTDISDTTLPTTRPAN
ncbi:MAG: OmpA family protein [Planctomycetota bacterium]|nr:OmpA family protein [Planctomycetota bacterium]